MIFASSTEEVEGNNARPQYISMTLNKSCRVTCSATGAFIPLAVRLAEYALVNISTVGIIK